MADFSPTGYWAHYDAGDDGVYSLPVAAFAPDEDVRSYAVICNEEGYIVRADIYSENGTFLFVTPFHFGA